MLGDNIHIEDKEFDGEESEEEDIEALYFDKPTDSGA